MATVESLIADRFAVDSVRPLPEVGGGLPAFACVDQLSGHAGLMALRVQPGRPPRAGALASLVGQDFPGLVTPLAHGPALGGYYVVCPLPQGQALGQPLATALRPWPEKELLDCLLRPVAQVLAMLGDRQLTHRAVRLNNLFRTGPGMPVLLGAAWAAPPGSLQPVIYEPLYSAICLPEGRGDGTIADDVYALGVVLVTLALGRVPLAGLDDAAILRRKADLGSYEAMVGDERLSPIIADIARSMLAEDPEHRPPPVLLTDPVAARARRVAARPPRHAAQPLEIGRVTAWNVRGATLALAMNAPAGIAALRAGVVDRWLRRSVGDASLASHVEEATRQRAAAAPEDEQADAACLLSVIAVLDPLAPLCWRGIAIWPDGLGPALAAAAEGGGNGEITARLQEIVAGEIFTAWAGLRPERCDEALLRREARRLRALLGPLGVGGGGEGAGAAGGGMAGGLPRLRYVLNPLLPCASPLFAGHWVARLSDLLPALEEASARVDQTQVEPFDADIAGFVAARSDQREERDQSTTVARDDAASVVRAQLRLFAGLQLRVHRQRPLPGLTAWLVARAAPLLATWYHLPNRAALAEQLAALVEAGQILALLALLEDPVAREMDAHGAIAAVNEVARIDAELNQLLNSTSERAELARRLGQELAAGAGLVGLAAVLTAAALGWTG